MTFSSSIKIVRKRKNGCLGTTQVPKVRRFGIKLELPRIKRVHRTGRHFILIFNVAFIAMKQKGHMCQWGCDCPL